MPFINQLNFWTGFTGLLGFFLAVLQKRTAKPHRLRRIFHSFMNRMNNLKIWSIHRLGWMLEFLYSTESGLSLVAIIWRATKKIILKIVPATPKLLSEGG
ncbi:MAG: hypothetical protein PVF09_16455 [Desulfobacterales bacterium]|jgi:hypothetical protein